MKTKKIKINFNKNLYYHRLKKQIVRLLIGFIGRRIKAAQFAKLLI